MIIEFVMGFGGLIGILILLAEGTRKPEMGVFACILLFILSAWVLMDGMQYKTGDTILTTTTGTDISTLDNATNITTIDLNETVLSQSNPIYSNVPTTPFFDIVLLFGLLFTLLGMYGLMHYVMEIFDY